MLQKCYLENFFRKSLEKHSKWVNQTPSGGQIGIGFVLTGWVLENTAR